MRKTIKTYEEQGTHYQFDYEKLQLLINQRKQNLNKAKKKVTKAEIMDELATATNVSNEAIKNWMYGYNGPSDLEQIKSIGKYFNQDYHFLLKKEEDKLNTYIEDKEQALYTRERIREIYGACLKFVNRGAYYQDQIMEKKGFIDDEMISGASMPDLMRSAMDEMYPLLDDIRDLLNSYLLDIPGSFYDKVSNYTYEKQDDLIGYYHFAYAPADEEEGTKEYLDINEDAYSDACDYFFGRGLVELRELFQDYIVK